MSPGRSASAPACSCARPAPARRRESSSLGRTASPAIAVATSARPRGNHPRKSPPVLPRRMCLSRNVFRPGEASSSDPTTSSTRWLTRGSPWARRAQYALMSARVATRKKPDVGCRPSGWNVTSMTLRPDAIGPSATTCCARSRSATLASTCPPIRKATHRTSRSCSEAASPRIRPGRSAVVRQGVGGTDGTTPHLARGSWRQPGGGRQDVRGDGCGRMGRSPRTMGRVRRQRYATLPTHGTGVDLYAPLPTTDAVRRRG